jgi:ankyrin repeat protein
MRHASRMLRLQVHQALAVAVAAASLAWTAPPVAPEASEESPRGKCHGNPDFLRAQLDAGADPNKKFSGYGSWGTTWLMGAAACGDLVGAQLLLDAGARVDEQRGTFWHPSGRTALSFAAEQGQLEVATLLLDRGASPNAIESNGPSPLRFAARPRLSMTCQPALISLLLARGARVDDKDHLGLTALHHAAGSLGPPASECARRLLDHGARVNARTRGGATALHYATLSGTPEVIRMLAAAGVNLDAGDETGVALLETAERRGDPEVLRAVRDVVAARRPVPRAP